jgi:uncharacterized protein (TIGR02466 family)
MREAEVHYLWPTPVMVFNIPVKQSWHDAALSENYRRMDTDNGYITENTYILNSYPEIKEMIQEHLEVYTRNLLKISKHVGFRFTNSWFLKHDPDDLAHGHHHKNSMITGTYYIDVPKNSGKIRFNKNYVYTNLFLPTVTPDFDSRDHVTSDWWEIEPSQGTLIFFPSIVDHSVGKNNSGKVRYSLAFNAFATGKIGGLEYELEL